MVAPGERDMQQRPLVRVGAEELVSPVCVGDDFLRRPSSPFRSHRPLADCPGDAAIIFTAGTENTWRFSLKAHPRPSGAILREMGTPDIPVGHPYILLSTFQPFNG